MHAYFFCGESSAQEPEAYLAWEEFLRNCDFARLIEFGTGFGTLSLYLYLCCLNKKAAFYTYDNRDSIKSYREGENPGSVVRALVGFERHFYQWDIWEHVDEIGDLIQQSGRSIVFCDGVEKPREFSTFGEFLKPGDIIGAHDWEDVKSPTSEIVDADVTDACGRFGLVPYVPTFGTVQHHDGLKGFYDVVYKTATKMFQRGAG